MKVYAVILEFVESYVERRAPYREAHLARLAQLHREGTLILAGPFDNPVDGGLLLFRAASRDEVEAIVSSDVYYQAGLWPRVVIHEWNVAVGALPEARPVA